MEFRTWTQGVTFCTRMDYLTPMFQEAAYCLGVEKLLGVTDQIPERASVIRVLMMELNRISSHLVALATGGMEMGATTVMTVGFRERERILDRLRDDHRPADEQRLHPPRRRRPGPAAAAPSTRSATWIPVVRKGLRRARARCCNENPILKGRTVDVGYLDLDRLHRARHHRPDAALDRPAARPAQARARTAATRPTTSTSSPATSCDAYGRLPHPARRDVRVAEDRRAGRRPAAGRRRPGHGRGQEDRLAGAARHRRRRHGQQPRPHPQDHGHLDGVADPPLQAGDRGLPGARRARSTRRSSRPRASSACHLVTDGGTRPYRAHFRDPSLQQPAGHGRDVRGRPDRRRHRRGRLDRPGDGRRGP